MSARCQESAHPRSRNFRTQNSRFWAANRTYRNVSREPLCHFFSRRRSSHNWLISSPLFIFMFLFRTLVLWSNSSRCQSRRTNSQSAWKWSHYSPACRSPRLLTRYGRLWRRTLRFFAISMKSVPNVVRCGNLAWYSASWRSGDNFLFALFFVVKRPYIRQYHLHGTKNGVIRFGFHKLSENLLCSLSTLGRFFNIEWGFPVKILKLWTTLKRWPWFPWKPKLCLENHFWTSFQKNVTWMDSEKVNKIFPRVG